MLRDLLKKLHTGTGRFASSTLFQGAGFTAISGTKATQSSRLSQLFSGTDLVQFVQSLFIFALTLGAIIAVVRLMYAGYLYMGSGGMWGSIEKAKEIFGNVVFGTLLLLAVWLILNQINPNILNLDILSTIRQNKATGLKSLPASKLNAQTQGNAAGGAGCTLTDPRTGACLSWQ